MTEKKPAHQCTDESVSGRGLELERSWRGLGAMGNGKDEKKSHAVGSAVVATAGVALGYAALELGLGGFLKPGREAIQHSLDPDAEAAARQQATELTDQVNHDAKAHENATHTPLPPEKLAESLQQHAAAPPAAPPAAPSASEPHTNH